MHQRWLKAIAVIVGVGTAPLVTTNGNAQSCSGSRTCAMGATAERPSRVGARVEQLLDKEGGREALVVAAMGNERFVADYMDAIAQDQDLREHAARLVREAPEKGALRKSQGQAVAYSCPMHPEVTSDRPSTCPKCGMALERRVADTTPRSFDRGVRRAAERLVRDERHRDEVVDALLADQAFTEAWIVAAGSDPRWREEVLQAWGGQGPGSSTRRQDRSSRDAAHFTCPMHPEVISDRPGLCPKCGMELERKAN